MLSETYGKKDQVPWLSIDSMLALDTNVDPNLIVNTRSRELTCFDLAKLCNAYTRFNAYVNGIWTISRNLNLNNDISHYEFKYVNSELFLDYYWENLKKEFENLGLDIDDVVVCGQTIFFSIREISAKYNKARAIARKISILLLKKFSLKLLWVDIREQQRNRVSILFKNLDDEHHTSLLKGDASTPSNRLRRKKLCKMKKLRVHEKKERTDRGSEKSSE